MLYFVRDGAGYRDREINTRGGLRSANDILGGGVVGTNPANTTKDDLMYGGAGANANYPGKRRLPGMGDMGGTVPGNTTSDGLAATSGYGTRAQQANQRMSHMQSANRTQRTPAANEAGYASSATGSTTAAASTAPVAAAAGGSATGAQPEKKWASFNPVNYAA